MFTGIIQAKGHIADMRQIGGDVRLRLQSDELPWASYAVGDSISVNGVCLTAVTLHADGCDMDVSNETLAVTALKSLKAGSRVNLEPALALGDRLGGHLVSGHVDCLGEVVAITDDARSWRLRIRIPEQYARYVAKKGSICVDGVSLTINDVSGAEFDLNIIPHTSENTIIGLYAVGTQVNIEVDLLARYIERLLGKDEQGLSLETLREHGYA
jgi:riboflavin synthase